MSLLNNIALITGIGATTLGYGSFAIKDATSAYNKGSWDWQYKGKLFEDRVGNFSAFSDNKSRYNDYLRGYGSAPKVGYSFDLTGVDVHVETNKRIVQQSYISNNNYNYKDNPNLALIGNPTGANTSDSNNYILENKVEGRSQFVTSYNNEKGRPNWVAFKLTKNTLGNVSRQNDFRNDSNLPSNFKKVDFTGFKGFDRGHLANSAAFRSTAEINSSTYVMTNILAQAHEVNAGPWADLEAYLNKKVHEERGPFGIFGYTEREVQIITGGAGKGGIGKNGYVENINGVEVPKVLWKVAIVLEPGQTTITKDTKTIAVIMPNSQNVKENWKDYKLADGRQIRELTGIKRLFPHLTPEVEEQILQNVYDAPKDSKNLLHINLDDISSSFESKAIINARAKGIHNPLLAPLYDTDKEYKGLVITNKRTHSQQFELARYNASMRASGRFTSVVDAEDMGTYEGILRASKTDNNLSRDEIAVAKAFDFAVNTPSLVSRINEFFFIPNGMGRVLQEERGPIPSLFGVVGALIDQSYLTNNPVLRSYKDDGENYFTTKTSFFQDLLANSAATILATASSIGVYLAVGEPLKAMASRALLNSQEALIKAADTNNAAKWALGGTDNDNIGFKMSVIERQVKGATTPYYSLDNPTFSLYYLDNYQRQRGGFFFSTTAREFLISKINPYTLGSDKSKALISATNDYLEVLQSPADIKIIDRAGEVITNGTKTIDWNTINITTASGKTFNIPNSIQILRDKTNPVSANVAKEINDAINKQYELKITNVSLERNMMLAKKIQAVINLVPMPWAWGIFAGRKDNVTAPMIGNLLDIEGFARHVNASLNNQGFWGAANEYMLFSENGSKASYPAFRIMNHITTMTRSILSFNTRGGQSKRDLEDIKEISKTYSQAEINLEDNVKRRTNNSIESAKNRSARGFDIFNTDALDAVSVEELLDNEATYQAKWKALSGKRVGLRTITLDDALYTYANKTHGSGSVGFLLNHLDKGNSYVGMKISSSKLAAAKWIIGALFIPQLVLTEFAQSTGASLLTSTLAQIQLNRGTTNTSIELQSTNFFSAAELFKMAGANDHLANFVLGTQSLVTMAGIARWAYDHASTGTTEIHGKMFSGQALLNNIAEVNGQAVQSATMNELTTLSAGKNAITVKLISGKELGFNVVRENGNITGLSALNAKVAKNWTSFSISLGLTLAAMQTARYVISSSINNERNLMGSAVLSTAVLAVPAIAFGVTTTIDNMAHSLHIVSGSKLGYSNYKVTSMLGNTLLKGLQGTTNLFGRNPITTTAISLIGLTTAYWNKLSPFQGDINGPKLDETNQTAIARLGSYVEHVNKRIDQARTSEGGSATISDSISPLEVNAALLAIALGKIINPITSSQKGSTAYVTATQSPLPIFQYYSVIKKVVDSNGSSYTTINLGLQGPPAIGVAPVNVSFPIAFAMNAKSADNITIKTGYLGTGLILNEGNKDSLSLQDYYNIYSQVALWSGIGLGVSNTLVRNRIWGRNHQLLKTTGTIIATESLLTQSTRAARDKFLGIATLPFYIAAQSLNLTTGDFRMPGLRLRSTSFVPVVFSAFMGGAIGNHLYSVINTLSQPFTNKKEDKEGNFALRGASILTGATLIGGISYAKGTIAASRRLAMLETELNITNSVRFDKRNIDPLVAWMYSNNNLKGLYRNTINKFGGFVKQSAVFQTGTLENKIGKGIGLLAVGALWNHFITDPTSGKVNPELAFGDLTKNKEDNYSNSTRRMTTVAFGATLFALTAAVTSFNPKSLVFADINPEQIVERFRNRLTGVERLQQVPQGKKNIGFIQSLRLKYEIYKLNMEAREVQIIIEEGMGNSPIIQAVKDASGKIFKNAINVNDPYSNIKEVTSKRANDVYNGLQSLDTSAGTDLNSIIKNNQASAILNELDKFGNPANNQHASAVLKSMSINRSASNRVHIERWARLGGTTALLGLAFHGLNWASQGMGYKDFQDALMGADEDLDTPWANFRKGVVDFVKLQTRYDRSHSYDISKGLVGPNLHNSKGEFLITPDSTTKGAINNSLKQLSNLIIVNSPNTFIGVAVGGITIRPDDNDVRLRDYFQIQSASQDFSSAMYSMSSVFGLQELAKKGFLAQTIIANLRGIDDAVGFNQAQLRQFGSNIITAVYSQPTRSGKDRIKFTSPSKFTLEAMTTNKALAMSLNQRYKRLQALSYGTNVNIALYTLMNNMNIASPDMQSKFYKALKDISNNGSQTGLGELNQNFFMGGEITIKQIGGLASNSNPFVAAKMSIEDSNNENAFMEMQGIALQSTTNQYDTNKGFFDRATEFLAKVKDSSSLQGLTQALPPFMWLPITAIGLSSLALVTSAIAVVATTKASQGQVTKDNTLLWEQQHKYFDEGKWFSKHLYEAEELKAAAGKFLLLRRTQVVFTIAEGLTDFQAKKYTSQINELSGSLSMKFDSTYRDYSKNYGQQHTQQLSRLNDFYDELENRSAPSQTTRLSTKDDRIARTHAREFKSVMFSETLDETITYNHTTHKITEHLLDEYTNKQVLDAYLEGQYDAYNAESKTPISKADFVDKYYKGFKYDDLLNAKANEFLSKPAGKFGGGFNIFGKDRSPNMRYSIDLMTEVYAAKFDIIIDNYYDVIDERIKAAFIQDADNIYTNSVRRELNSTAIIDEDYVKKVSVDQRFNNKLHLRDQIKDRLTTIISTKRTGLTAVFDRLLNIVSGGTNRDLITRMSLEATDASKEVLDNVRKYGGGMFNTPTVELQEEIGKAIEADIKQNSRSGLKGSMPVGVPPKALQTTAGLTVLEGLSRLGTVLINGYQMAMFVSTNLLTFRAAASIASNKTGEREKEMAREEMAKESFDNIWGALFFGTLLMNQSIQKSIVPGIGGLAAGFFGYDLLFKNNGTGGRITAGAIGITLAVSSIALFKSSKTWSVSLGLAGLTLAGRSVFDLAGSSLSSLSPELGGYITSKMDDFYQGGRQVIRNIQNQSGVINTIGGLSLAVGGTLNYMKTGNPINAGVAAIGALIFGVGLGYSLDSKNSRLEGASLQALDSLSSTLITPYIANKIGQTIVAKTITSKVTEQIAKVGIIQSASTAIRNAALQKTAQGLAIRSLATGAQFAGAGLKAISGVAAGPWGLVASLVLTAVQIVWILNSPETADEFASNLSNMPTQMFGAPGSFLLKPANQIYNDTKYRDKDYRNPLFQGTVNDAMKQEWLAQVDTLDDPTGRKTAGRFVTSFDAPMTGYNATAEGYGPISVDSSQDFAFAIRGKAYNQLITGKQFWNTRMDDKLNHEVISRYLNITERMQIQAWEQQINKVVDVENRKITSAPIIGSTEINAISREAMNKLGEVSTKLGQVVNDVNEINNKKTLALNIVANYIEPNPQIQLINDGTPNIQSATKIIKGKTEKGQTTLEFNQTSSKDSEQIALQLFNIKRGTKVIDGIINT